MPGMGKPVLDIVQRKPPAHRRVEPGRLDAVRRLDAVPPVVHGERVTAARFHQSEALPFCHAAEPAGNERTEGDVE